MKGPQNKRPADLTWARSDVGDQTAQPRVLSTWALLVLGPARGLWATGVMSLQNNTYKHSSEKQFVQRLRQGDTAEDDAASERL